MEAEVALWGGDWERAEALLTELREQARRGGSRYNGFFSSYWLARLHQAQGERAQAESLLQEALAIGVDGQSLPAEM